MEQTYVSKQTSAFGVSLAIASVLNAILVVAKEKSPSVMTGMAKLMGHHWITHSTIIIVLFFGIGTVLTRSNGGRGLSLSANRLISIVLSGVLLAALIIVGFYLFED